MKLRKIELKQCNACKRVTLKRKLRKIELEHASLSHHFQRGFGALPSQIANGDELLGFNVKCKDELEAFDLKIVSKEKHATTVLINSKRTQAGSDVVFTFKLDNRLKSLITGEVFQYLFENTIVVHSTDTGITAVLAWEGLGGGTDVGNWCRENDKKKVLIVIGGGHVPLHMDGALKDDVWTGDLYSGYSLPMEDPKEETNADLGGTWK